MLAKVSRANDLFIYLSEVRLSWLYSKMGKKGVDFMHILSLMLTCSLCLTACTSMPETLPDTSESLPVSSQMSSEYESGFHIGEVLNGENGEIHYSYYLPEGYQAEHLYPMIVVMPGYDKMWFGEDSEGSNVDWNGVQAWTKLNEDMIVVSAQLTDWGEKSAKQANELTEYFIENFAVDQSRVYAAGYSAGGETMSRAVSMRPDLYAAYIHGASQWDGDYESIAENKVAVYIFMAENDEYYGSEKARDAYDRLYSAYQETGLSNEEIDLLLQVEIPDNEYFNRLGIDNYHAGGTVLFDDEKILNWVLQKQK